jgi:ankyrin repeat protein
MKWRVIGFLGMTVWAPVALSQVEAPKEPLCLAALDGDVPRVRTLLAGGANPNVRDDKNRTPLMLVAMAHSRSSLDVRKDIKPDFEGVGKLLIDKGADVNAHDSKGRTALLLAMEGSASEYRVVGGDDRIARLLVARGADVNARDNDGWTALLRIANLWADQESLMEFLIGKGADVNARLNDGRTALMLAARIGKDERVRVLMAKRADVNARDKSGTTALMIASAVQWDDASVSMIRQMAAKGVDLNTRDEGGRTAADRAAEAGYIERAKLLIDAGTKIADNAAFMKSAKNFALLKAMVGGDTPAAKTLLDEGADANFRDGTGQTVLMIASNEEYSAERAVLLLEHGASANLAGANGDTALMVAADRYQPEIVKALLDHGADPNAADRNGNTVLMRAAASKFGWQEERKPLIHFLLEKGADAGRKNARGVTALMLMAREGNPGLALLLEKSVEVDGRDDEGNTALHHASRMFARGWPRRNGWALLGKGADVNASNQRGETPLILAATQYEADAAKLLLEKHADVHAKTKNRRTALMQAIDGPKEFDNENHVVYSPQIAKLLIEAGADVNAKDADGNSALSIAKKRGYDDIATELVKAGAK